MGQTRGFELGDIMQRTGGNLLGLEFMQALNYHPSPGIIPG